MARGRKGLERLKRAQLCRRLKVDRKTLNKYLAMDGAPEPDAGQSYDAAETIAFVSARCAVAKPSSVAHWRSKELELKCEALTDDLARRRGEYISRAEASRTLIPLMTELGQLLRQKFVMELPARYRGRDAVETAQLNEAALDEVIQRFRTGAKPLLG